MKKLLFLFFLCGFMSKAGNPPSIIFKENKGQWPDKVLFGTEFLNTKFYINKTGLNYCIYNLEELSKSSRRDSRNSIVHGHNYEVNLEGANLTSFVMRDNLTEYYNYFLGRDKSKWTNHVKACAAIEFHEIYKGINLNVYSNSINLKYDFIVLPNADPGQIKLNYNFTDGVQIRNGQLIIKTSVGEIIEKAPVAYQQIEGTRVLIECAYELKGNSVSYKFPKGYNKNYALIIDPVVIVCSYSGTSSFAAANSCNYDAVGNIYLSGWAKIGYPTTTGAFQIIGAGDSDIFLSVFNSNGSAKLFSTYIGGYNFEMAIDIEISKRDITILGISYSEDYPCSQNAFDITQDGSNDLVVTKLNLTGTSLIASTFVGGNAYEDFDQFSQQEQISSEMVADTKGNIYITSNTTSSDFPVTTGALSTVRSGSSDGVVFKMDTSLNMVWSTYLGGSGKEDGLNIRPDGLGGVYVAGTTSSLDFPTTPGAYDQAANSTSPYSTDMFVAHINNTGTALISSTYLGTTTIDDGAIMDVDASYNVYVSGRIGTIAPGFLTPTPGTYSTQSSNSIYKLDSSLTNLNFQTLFGGVYPRPNFMCTAMKVDSCGNIYLAGWAWVGQPSTPDKFQSFAAGGTDMYMMVFNPNCSSLRFASYFGGTGTTPTGWSSVGEYSWGKSHFDEKGVLYLAMYATDNLPTTSGAYCTNYNNNLSSAKIYNDAFLKVDFQTYVKANSSYGSNIIACPPPFTANFVSTTNTGTTYWDFGDGNTSTQNTTSHTYSSLGTYSVLLVVTDTTTCNRIDSIKSTLNVVNPTNFDIGETIYLCPEGNLILRSNVTAISYSWSTGETTQNILIDKPGTYSLTIFNGGCYSGDDVKVEVGENKITHFPNVITPNSDGANDFIDFTKFQFSEMEFIVFDRWGKERYRITDPSAKWEPNDLNNGTYYYIISYFSDCTNKHATYKGFITLFK